MADIALDANVLVGLLDRQDSLHKNAVSLLRRLVDGDRRVLLLDLCVSETVSVLCRRAAQRKSNPPDLGEALATIRSWVADGLEISFVQAELEQHIAVVLEVVERHAGVINFNDAFLVVLQRLGRIGDLATFDRNFDEVEGFLRIE